MQSGMIEGVTRVVGKAQGYNDLAIRDELGNCSVNGEGTPVMVTAWFPLPDELERINAGAPIHLHILGVSPPPVRVDVGRVPE